MTAIPARGPRPTDTTESPAAAWRTLEGGGATIEGGLWARRQQINRDAALPHGYRMLEVAGNLENLRRVHLRVGQSRAGREARVGAAGYNLTAVGLPAMGVLPRAKNRRNA